MVGRIQYGSQSGERVRQESAHASLRGIWILLFRLPLLPRRVDACPPEGVGRHQKEQHLPGLLRGGPYGLHRPALGGQVSRRSGEVRTSLIAKVRHSSRGCFWRSPKPNGKDESTECPEKSGHGVAGNGRRVPVRTAGSCPARGVKGGRL